MQNDPFERKGLWHDVASVETLHRMLVTVRDELQIEGMEPGAEIWTTNRGYFLNHGRTRLVDRWCELTDNPPEMFPWTDDFLVQSWVAWRKTPDDRKRAIREHLGLMTLGASLF